VDESRDPLEKLWRPREVVRIAAVLTCGPIHVYDLALDTIGGIVTVAAQPPFSSVGDPCDQATEVCDVDVMGSTPEIELPVSALTIRRVELASGGTAYLSGDLLVRVDGGRLVREGLAEQGLTAIGVEASDVPDDPLSVEQRVEEWSFSVKKVQMRHWADVVGTPKGKRVVTVSADVVVDAKALERRLRPRRRYGRLRPHTRRRSAAMRTGCCRCRRSCARRRPSPGR
jgi:hypothetical protein